MPARSENMKMPLARVAYSDGLFKPRAAEEGGKEKYGCTLIFPKSTDLSAFKEAALKVAVEEWGEKAKKMIADGIIKSPFLDGDGPQGISRKTGERYKYLEGCTFIRASSLNKPPVVDRRALPVTDPEVVYSGSYGYAVVNLYAWENSKNGKGISFGIQAYQFAKDGDRLGGGAVDPGQYFEKIVDDDGEASGDTSDGAGGLFG